MWGVLHECKGGSQRIRWSDGDVKDPWCVGYYTGVGQGGYHLVSYLRAGSWRDRNYNRITKVSKKRGEWILSNMALIEQNNKTIYWWLRQPMNKKVDI